MQGKGLLLVKANCFLAAVGKMHGKAVDSQDHGASSGNSFHKPKLL